jgi:indolepyruvate ferredoxin oxidoreductase, alpha subunit
MKNILLGNEAIIKAALASGVSFVSGYPGCPSAEIGDGLGKIAKENNIYAEWSTNEKTGLEAAIGASFSGLRSLVNMKSFGINVASDVLLPLAYTGVKAGMVIFVGDDPSCHSSAQSEQDSRGYAYLAKVPVLDPSSPQECYDFTKLGFEISEKFNVPVILRAATRVAHQRSTVEFDSPKQGTTSGNFVKNHHQFLTMPPRVMEMKKELLEKLKKIQAYAEKSNLNPIRKPSASNGASKIGIITSGISYLHVLEALEELKLDLPVLKLGFFYPLPGEKIKKFIKPLKKVLVVEELDPYLEKEIIILAQKANLKLEVFGKNLLPEIGELDAEKVCVALAKITGKKFTQFKTKQFDLPKRTARLCEGCPYWYILPTIKRIAPEGTIFGGDIGCNMIGALPPHNMYDYMFCMGSSIGISHGVKKASPKQKVVSFMGDGTFFHSGIAGMINAVYNKSNPLMVVMDNRITAMTGHQTNPGMGKTLMGEDTPELQIADIAKSCGVKNIKVLDPINIKELEDTVKEFLEKDEISLIVCKRICALLERRLKKSQSS